MDSLYSYYEIACTWDISDPVKRLLERFSPNVKEEGDDGEWARFRIWLDDSERETLCRSLRMASGNREYPELAMGHRLKITKLESLL